MLNSGSSHYILDNRAIDLETGGNAKIMTTQLLKNRNLNDLVVEDARQWSSTEYVKLLNLVSPSSSNSPHALLHKNKWSWLNMFVEQTCSRRKASWLGIRYSLSKLLSWITDAA